MKKHLVFFVIFLLAFNFNAVFAQQVDDEDGQPYLSDEDIDAIEHVLTFDDLENAEDSSQGLFGAAETDDDEVYIVEEEDTVEAVASASEPEKPSRSTVAPDASETFYHLLILDRTYSRLDSDISGTENISVVYKFVHGRNGYIVAIYKASAGGQVLPVLPNKSRIIVHLSSVQKRMIQDYVNSTAFRRLVTNRAATAQLTNLFGTNW